MQSGHLAAYNHHYMPINQIVFVIYDHEPAVIGKCVSWQLSSASSASQPANKQIGTDT